MTSLHEQTAPKPVDKSERPLRILHLNAGNLYGGVETVLVTLARLNHLCPGMEPHFGLCYEGRLSAELAAAGTPVHMLGQVRLGRPWTVWRARRRLQTLLRREHYDVVVCHQPWSLVVFGGTCKAEGQQLGFWEHNYHFGRSWLERMARWTVPDVAISTSRFVKTCVQSSFPSAPTEVVHAPVALADRSQASQWRSAVRREYGVDDDTTAIIQVSRFEPRKGYLLHLNGLARLKSRNWVCWFVGGAQNAGEQQYLSEVRNAAERLGIADRIRFLGQRSDVAQLLAGADVFCHPNDRPEPFGIVFIEALWAGLPVVATAMGGALEIIDDSCGLLTEPANPADLAAALDQLIQSPQLRAQLGAAGPARARQLCDPATQLRTLEQAIRKNKKDGVKPWRA